MQKSFVTSEKIGKLTGVVHGFGFAGRSIEELTIEHDPLIHNTHQIHGNDVHVLRDNAVSQTLNGDAFISSCSNIACFVRTADCVPILIADPVNRAVAAVHAGWRGTALNIVSAATRKMTQEFGTKPEDLIAAIGPAICGECYEVGPEVLDALGASERTKNTVDLKEINREHLINCGVIPGNIDLLNTCTACSGGDFASYRRDKNKVRQVNFIFLS